MEQKGKGYQGNKNTRNTLNIAITEKNENQYVRKIIQQGIPGPQGEFSDNKVTLILMILLMSK